MVLASNAAKVKSSHEGSTLLKDKLSIKKVRYCRSKKCISSKAGQFVLLWNFIVSLVSGFIFFCNLPLSNYMDYSFSVIHGCVAIVYVFYPLAGHLADTKFGRYKTVTSNLWIFLCGLLLTLLGVLVLVCTLTFKPSPSKIDISVVVGLIALAVGAIILIISNIGFSANALQFGLDQLYDTPAQDQSVFIYWYLWTDNLGILVATLMFFNMSDESQTLLLLKCILSILVLVIPVLLISLCLASHKKLWFLIEPCRRSPYALVYKISKFARKHKIPIRRSAFTYCEDEIPRGLDLGKDKYGGPFTTEQVEDVKAFYGILKILLALCLVYFLLFSSEPDFHFIWTNQTMEYPFNDSIIKVNKVQEIILQNVVLYSLLPSLYIPLYLLLVQPFLINYTFGMLRRMGFGAIVILVCEIVSLVVYSVAYMKHIDLGVMYNSYAMLLTPLSTHGSCYLITVLIIKQIIAALGTGVFDIALLEFICSQSPTCMKGLLIGLSYTIRGSAETVSNTVLLVLADTLHDDTYFNTEMMKQTVSVVIGTLAVLVYLYVVKSYKYRERDEPCHVRRFVEEYYSQTQKERLYDYSISI